MLMQGRGCLCMWIRWEGPRQTATLCRSLSTQRPETIETIKRGLSAEERRRRRTVSALTCLRRRHRRPLGSVSLHTQQTAEIRHTSAPSIHSAQPRGQGHMLTHSEPTYRRRVAQFVAANFEVALGRVFILHLWKEKKVLTGSS